MFNSPYQLETLAFSGAIGFVVSLIFFAAGIINGRKAEAPYPNFIQGAMALMALFVLSLIFTVLISCNLLVPDWNNPTGSRILVFVCSAFLCGSFLVLNAMANQTAKETGNDQIAKFANWSQLAIIGGIACELFRIIAATAVPEMPSLAFVFVGGALLAEFVAYVLLAILFRKCMLVILVGTPTDENVTKLAAR